mmetsp:Transcript_114315/g.328408  ORF Transcript_114315/g.328408 Transcript_114315/m.328408 type:complete len:218 (-) Transcript_114315:488-1141(-)
MLAGELLRQALRHGNPRELCAAGGRLANPGVLQGAPGAEPLRGVLRQEEVQVLLARAGGPLVLRMLRVEVAEHTVAKHHLDVVAAERKLPTDQVIQGGAEAPHVGLQTATALPDDLRRAEARGSPRLHDLLRIMDGASYAEVRQHRRAVSAQHDVLGLHVAVHEAQGVHVLQPAEHVAEHRPSELLCALEPRSRGQVSDTELRRHARRWRLCASGLS